MPLYIGLCGSSSVSHLAWCLRWIAAHSLVIMDVVSQVQKRKKCARTGWKSTPRCAWLRCRYKVTEKIVSWVATSRYSARPQKPVCSRPPARKSSRETGIMKLQLALASKQDAPRIGRALEHDGACGAPRHPSPAYGVQVAIPAWGALRSDQPRRPHSGCRNARAHPFAV